MEHSAGAESHGDRADQGSLCQFYTKPHIGVLLVGLMGVGAPRRLVDLGSGDGSLSKAASGQWRGIELLTIDVDERCGHHLTKGLAELGIRHHMHMTLDALDFDLPDVVLNGRSRFDAALCNPPYRQPEWRPGFDKILDAANLTAVYTSPADVPAEVVFLAQTIRLTRDSGRIGLIVPDGFATGTRSAALRQLLLQQHRVDCVVQLPRHSFKNTEAQAYLLVLSTKVKSTAPIRLMRYDIIKGLSRPILATPEMAAHRMDFEYHACGERTGSTSTICLQDMGAQIIRGMLTSAGAKRADHPVFHTSDFPTKAGIGVRLPLMAPDTVLHKGAYAEPGDILIARVDRALQRKVTYVIEGCARLTDCVYRVRVPVSEQAKVVAALSSHNGEALLQAAARGVSARMLAKESLLTLPLPFHGISS